MPRSDHNAVTSLRNNRLAETTDLQPGIYSASRRQVFEIYCATESVRALAAGHSVYSGVGIGRFASLIDAWGKGKNGHDLTVLRYAGCAEEFARLLAEKAVPDCFDCARQMDLRTVPSAISYAVSNCPSGTALIAIKIPENLAGRPLVEAMELLGGTRVLKGGQVLTSEKLDLERDSGDSAQYSIVVDSMNLSAITEENVSRLADAVPKLNMPAMAVFRGRESEAEFVVPLREGWFCSGCGAFLERIDPDELSCADAELKRFRIGALSLADYGAMSISAAVSALGDDTPSILSSLERSGAAAVLLGQKVSTLSQGELIVVDLMNTLEGTFEEMVLLLDGVLGVFCDDEADALLVRIAEAVKEKSLAVVVSAPNSESTEFDFLAAQRASEEYLISPVIEAGKCTFPELRVPAAAWTVVRGPIGSGKTLLLHHLLKLLPLRSKSKVLSTGRIKFSLRTNVGRFLGLERTLAKSFAASAESGRRGLIPEDYLPDKSRYRCSECEGSGYVFERRAKRAAPSASEEWWRAKFASLEIAFVQCPGCGGTGLGGEPRLTTLHGTRFSDCLAMGTASLQALIPEADRLSEAAQKLALFSMGHMPLNLPLIALSLGQLRQLELVRCALSARSGGCLLLDNIMVGLDKEIRERVCVYLRELTEEGITIVLADNSGTVLDYADYLVELAKIPDHRTLNAAVKREGWLR